MARVLGLESLHASRLQLSKASGAPREEPAGAGHCHAVVGAALELPKGVASKGVEHPRSQLSLPAAVAELHVLAIAPCVCDATTAQGRRVPPPTRHLLPARSRA